MDDESSEKTLINKKKKKDNIKIDAARQRTNARFQALLNVGSGSEEISERTPRSEKKKERTKTADSAIIKPKRTPNGRTRSRSQENLLDVEDQTDVSNAGAKPLKKPTPKQKKKVITETSNEPASTTKKKKKKVVRKDKQPDSVEDGTENDAYERSFNGGEAVEDSITQTADDENSQKRNEEDADIERRKKRKKKKKASTTERIVQAIEKKRHDDGLLMCILVHKADQLKPDARVHHPVVRVHMVNMDTGQYVKKTNNERNVTSLHENTNENENIDFILPMMTPPYDFKQNRSFTPHWEKTLIYNEVYSYFLQREADDPPVVVFFELLDFMQMNLKQKEFSRTDKGWHRIAWAFLKLVSPTGATNTDKKVRLQLYQPITRVRVHKDDNTAIEIYQWWKYGTRVKYSSTLYVTVKGVLPPKQLTPSTRSTFPTQQERGELTFDELNTVTEAPLTSDHEMSTQIWVKLPGQVNRIPNKLDMQLSTGRKGCSAVKFSPDGRYIACACSTSDSYPILVYEFPSQKLVTTFGNHFGIIYDICWLQNGRELLSASADSTVRCWDTKRFSSSAIKLFPHPSYVYTCKYHPKQSAIVITGSYDRAIRVWNKISDGIHATLLRELPDHNGYVNTMTFAMDGNRFFSGDSNGVLIEWNCMVEKKKKSNADDLVNRWSLIKKIELDELKKTAISTLIMHPGQLKLLIHTKDSYLRMFDLRSYGILKTYVGGINFKEHIHASFSICGTFIFCGAENGLVHVWNTETGDHVYVYKDIGCIKSVTDIHFHPHDNFIAFCFFGDGLPVSIYSYDPKVPLELKETIGKSLPSNLLYETQKSLDETTQLYESMRVAGSITNDRKRKERIKNKLLSVTSRSMDDLSNTQRNRVTFQNLSPPDSDRVPISRMEDPKQTMLSTWGSDFTNTSPYPISPHAQQHLGASGRFFARSPNLGSSPLPSYNHNQSIDMHLDNQPLSVSQLRSTPKPVFTFNQNKTGKTKKQPNQKRVISLYEYKPNRSDELELQPNDVITVLYEDNESWWMGQVEDGRQGYFPVNYVMDADETDSSSKAKSASRTVDTGNSHHSAVVDKHGNLKIISGPEDTRETSVEVKRVRKKRKDRNNRSKFVDDAESAC